LAHFRARRTWRLLARRCERRLLYHLSTSAERGVRRSRRLQRRAKTNAPERRPLGRRGPCAAPGNSAIAAMREHRRSPPTVKLSTRASRRCKSSGSTTSASTWSRLAGASFHPSHSETTSSLVWVCVLGQKKEKHRRQLKEDPQLRPTPATVFRRDIGIVDSTETLSLNREFAIHGFVRVTDGRGGLPKVTLTHPSGSFCDVYLHGRGERFSPASFCSPKRGSIDDGQYGPCNQSDTQEWGVTTHRRGKHTS
jgi:hypothetical protein